MRKNLIIFLSCLTILLFTENTTAIPIVLDGEYRMMAIGYNFEECNMESDSETRILFENNGAGIRDYGEDYSTKFHWSIEDRTIRIIDENNDMIFDIKMVFEDEFILTLQDKDEKEYLNMLVLRKKTN